MFEGYESGIVIGILALVAAVGRELTKAALNNAAGSPEYGYGDQDDDEDQPQ